MKNAVRSLLCFVLILSAILCLAACGGSEKTTPTTEATVRDYVVGRYELVKIGFTNGLEAEGEQIAEYEGIFGDMYVDLFRDRTAQLAILGSCFDMEFSDNRMWQINHESHSYDFSVKGGEVILEKETGERYYFKKK